MLYSNTMSPLNPVSSSGHGENVSSVPNENAVVGDHHKERDYDGEITTRLLSIIDPDHPGKDTLTVPSLSNLLFASPLPCCHADSMIVFETDKPSPSCLHRDSWLTPSHGEKGVDVRLEPSHGEESVDARLASDAPTTQYLLGDEQSIVAPGECVHAIEEHDKAMDNDGETTTKLLFTIANDDDIIMMQPPVLLQCAPTCTDKLMGRQSHCAL
jgi:hypothetical protein